MKRSTLPLTIAGTLAVHLIVVLVVDVASVVGRGEDRPPPPRISLVDIDVRSLPPPEPPPEPPPPEPAPTTPPPPESITAPPVPPAPVRAPRTARATTPAAPTTALPPSTAPETPSAGGGPVVTLPGIAPAARGVAAASGQPTTRRTGRGGSGTGTGEGAGSGAGSGTAPVATSIASIKTPAEAKAGFDYFDARKSYPAEARRMGVEGKIRVRLLVDATGKVAQARLLGGGLGHGLDELALARARAIEFEPARDTDDRPVASVVVWTFTFTLPSDT